MSSLRCLPNVQQRKLQQKLFIHRIRKNITRDYSYPHLFPCLNSDLPTIHEEITCHYERNPQPKRKTNEKRKVYFPRFLYFICNLRYPFPHHFSFQSFQSTNKII